LENLAGLRFYEHCGFRIIKVGLAIMKLNNSKTKRIGCGLYLLVVVWIIGVSVSLFCVLGFYLSRKIVVEIELPDWVRLPRGEVEKRVKIELALRLYRKGIVSMGQARRLAGLSKWDFLELLAKEKIPLSYDVEELGKDLKTVEELFK